MPLIGGGGSVNPLKTPQGTSNLVRSGVAPLQPFTENPNYAPLGGSMPYTSAPPFAPPNSRPANTQALAGSPGQYVIPRSYAGAKAGYRNYNAFAGKPAHG
jgi:hypothetical protein